ncbi:MAG TPA: serine/threonine-protein kinase [Vicinamibacterales bacterium]|nr:serine/threonine-protein kinase [Vicinamibacterales bacterium]
MLGLTLSHYKITGKLGTGGMGVVYDADDLRLPRKVALKFLPDELADDKDAVRRFAREASTIALLSHPNICTIYDVDTHEGRQFIAMERLDGVTLKIVMAREDLELSRLLDIGRQITAALGAAHARGVVHRDIKPGNVMVADDGHVKVLDFGLARQFRMPGSNTIGLEGSTIPGRPLGTANYMAPERILQLPLDPRSDLFSLGVILYEMATGRLPFAGASPSDTVTNVLDREPEPITTLAPDRPASLEHVVMRLLAKRAADRYQSAEHLADALARVEIPPSTLATRLLRRLRPAR